MIRKGISKTGTHSVNRFLRGLERTLQPILHNWYFLDSRFETLLNVNRVSVSGSVFPLTTLRPVRKRRRSGGELEYRSSSSRLWRLLVVSSTQVRKDDVP